MKRFRCACGNEVYFENAQCVRCGYAIGYDSDVFEMVRIDTARGAAAPRLCANSQYGVCNWVVSANSPDTLCVSCKFSSTIPNLQNPENLTKWAKIELSKRYLLYSLFRWGLPIVQRKPGDARGLAFNFLSDEDTPGDEPVLTGHSNGLITLNIAEADDVERERRRTLLKEPYRTLVAHFRHEIGHYYWAALVQDQSKLDAFRAVFGDERRDYGEALQAHYNTGPQQTWPVDYISAYATSHPWEDFAETWAHYTHMVDTLETAYAYGLRMERPIGRSDDVAIESDPYHTRRFQQIVDDWPALTLMLNALNRSMGQKDAYPFVLSESVLRKLRFVHDLIHEQGKSVSRAGGRNPSLFEAFLNRIHLN